MDPHPSIVGEHGGSRYDKIGTITRTPNFTNTPLLRAEEVIFELPGIN